MVVGSSPCSPAFFRPASGPAVPQPTCLSEVGVENELSEAFKTPGPSLTRLLASSSGQRMPTPTFVAERHQLITRTQKTSSHPSLPSSQNPTKTITNTYQSRPKASVTSHQFH